MRQGLILVGLALAGAAALWATRTEERVAPAAGARMVAVTVPELGAAERAGLAAWEAHCLECHGPDAAGQEGVAPPLVHRIYEPSHHGDAAFFLAAAQGVRAHHWRFGDMPAVPGVSEAEVAAIVAYVRALQRANGIE